MGNDIHVQLKPWINQVHHADSVQLLTQLPENSIDLVITSPPYWTAVTYETQIEESSENYEDYLAALLHVWKQCERVLRPNGKLCINTPIMPIPKKIIGDQHTRHLKNINNDIEFSILEQTELLRYSLFIWQKQTSKLMFGSYPYPGNLLENNTIEFISVYVKPGKPPIYPKIIKEASQLSREEWLDLTQQVWFMYPADVKRKNSHPAPFPLKLPARLIRLYTFGSTDGFNGEIVLDPFCGTGATCVAAKMMNRNYIGIELSKTYVDIAQNRLENLEDEDLILFTGRAKYPGKDELLNIQTNSIGQKAEAKHKRQTYGRKI